MIKTVTLSSLIAAHGEPMSFNIRMEHIYLVGQALCPVSSLGQMLTSFNQLLAS